MIIISCENDSQAHRNLSCGRDPNTRGSMYLSFVNSITLLEKQVHNIFTQVQLYTDLHCEQNAYSFSKAMNSAKVSVLRIVSGAPLNSLVYVQDNIYGCCW